MSSRNLVTPPTDSALTTVAAILFFLDAALSVRSDWFAARLVLLPPQPLLPYQLMYRFALLSALLVICLWTLALLLAGVGLVRRWVWSRWLAMALAALTVLGAAFDLAHGRFVLGGIYLFFGLAILFHLARGSTRAAYAR